MKPVTRERRQRAPVFSIEVGRRDAERATDTGVYPAAKSRAKPRETVARRPASLRLRRGAAAAALR